MLIHSRRFNTFLLGAAIASALAGCQTAESGRDKHPASLSVHLEASSLLAEPNDGVPIDRAKPIRVNAEKTSFLDDARIAEASVLDVTGGFVIRVAFDRQGSWLLESMSALNPGKHFAIYAEWGKKPRQKRWLAAPLISRRVSNGTLVFTPDTSREEAEEIVRGLNQGAIKNGNQ